MTEPYIPKAIIQRIEFTDPLSCWLRANPGPRSRKARRRVRKAVRMRSAEIMRDYIRKDGFIEALTAAGVIQTRHVRIHG